jgi:hypothetical protein
VIIPFKYGAKALNKELIKLDSRFKVFVVIFNGKAGLMGSCSLKAKRDMLMLEMKISNQFKEVYLKSSVLN